MTTIVTPTSTDTESGTGRTAGTIGDIAEAIAEIGAVTDARSVELYAGRRLPDDLYRSATITPDGAHSRFGGRWTFNTGCHGATWIGGLALVRGATGDDGLPVVRWGWVPAARAEIVEDWDPSGLHGTGSHSTVIPEQDVPTSWTFDPFTPTTNDRGPNRCLVEAEARWLAALASVERELESMWDEAVTLEELTTEQRIRLHRANVEASRAAVHIVDAMCELTGTTSVARQHPLSRCRRDVHALQNHISVGASSIEHNAKVALGLESWHRLVRRRRTSAEPSLIRAHIPGGSQCAPTRHPVHP